MWSMLNAAQLGPEYWSWALLHAVYLKTHMPHRAIGITPYQAYTGKKPNLKHLRIFGSPVISRLPGRRPAKLDSHTSGGIFLGFTATSHNIYYRDSETKRIKIATHITFDEAGYSVPTHAQTPFQRALQRWGSHDTNTATDGMQNQQPTLSSDDQSSSILVQQLTPNATIPTRGTADSAGLDLYSAESILIPPGVPTAVPTDIAVCPPMGTYCQIQSRSGLILKHRVEAKAGVIDRDYTGNIKVILLNHSTEPYMVQKGDKIAQLVTYLIVQPTPQPISRLSHTSRGDKGFGSTDSESVIPSHLIPVNQICTMQVEATTTTATQVTDHIELADGIKPYNIWLCTDPFQRLLKIQLEVKGSHPTLGLIVHSCKTSSRVQLLDMAPGTPGIRLLKWRSTL
jgi:dUTP pyrophosphatase